MASKKISDLIPANTLEDGNQFAINQDGVSKRLGFVFLRESLSLRITGDVGYVPSATSNFSNRNEIVKSTVDNNYYFIDTSGVSLSILNLAENLFSNGLRLDNGKAKLGGSLIENTSIDLSNKNLSIIGNGVFNIGGTDGTSKFTLHSGEIEVKSGEIILKSSQSTKRFKMTIDDNGIWDSEEIT